MKCPVKYMVNCIELNYSRQDPLSYTWKLLTAWCTVICLLCTSWPANSAVTPGIKLSTDTNSVFLNDTIVIELEAVAVEGEIDLTPLFKHAELLRETTGTRIAVIEGRVVEVKLRRMELLPHKSGRAFFGPLTGDSTQGSVYSNTLVVSVLPPADTQWTPDDNDLQMSASLSSAQVTLNTVVGSDPPNIEVYTGEQLILDIVLRHKHAIAEEQIALPSLDKFDVMPAFEERRTLVDDESGTTWRQTAWRYYLFAQRAGHYTLDDILWRGTIIRSRTQRAAFEYILNGPRISAIPAAVSGPWWLPASDLTLTEEWSIPSNQISAGDELSRTITVSAYDVLSHHLPVIKPLESRSISSSLIRQERSQQKTGDRIRATATFEFRLLAHSPVPVFLDTVRVEWFDINSRSVEEAILPARRINVGLPERQDLLAELALQDKSINRWLFALQRISTSFAFWHVSLILLGCILITMYSLMLYNAWKVRHGKGNPNNRYELPEL